MKKASKKCQTKNIVFFDFSNHARARVPIFTPKIKKIRFARLARLARLSTRKWDFRRRSRPRELAQRSQDDVSLNKLPQIIQHNTMHYNSIQHNEDSMMQCNARHYNTHNNAIHWCYDCAVEFGFVFPILKTVQTQYPEKGQLGTDMVEYRDGIPKNSWELTC